jgi:ketosteroid isomerase-like protein
MRKAALTLFICAALTIIPACASNASESGTQTPAVTAAVPAEDVEATIIQLEKEWVTAIVNKDIQALDRLLAPEFNGTSPTGATFPKAAALEDIQEGSYSVESMELDEVSANIYGDVAVAFTSQQEKSKYDGKDISGHYHYTNVWVKKDGRWQVVASHGSPYPPFK